MIAANCWQSKSRLVMWMTPTQCWNWPVRCPVSCLGIGVTSPKSSLNNSGNRACNLLPLFDKLLLRKRSLVETINDQLKNISQIEHSRHRSPFNFFVNLIAGLVAYTFREKKPSLNIRLPQALPAVVL